jgi:transcriptional regulator with XRE-family HTH domain
MKLAEIRNERGLSQRQLSEESGVSVRMIQHYEQRVKDINKASAETIYRLSKALNCKMEDLIMEKEFKSIKNLGFTCGEYFEKDFDEEYHKHLDLDFIGVYGNEFDGWQTAYCDSVTGEIFIQDIYELTEDGIYEKLEIDDLVF